MEGMRDSDLGWYMGMSKIVGKNVGGGTRICIVSVKPSANYD